MDAIQLSIFSSRISSVCDEMGAVLRRAAFSPNIRDRLDYSCAVFDPQGQLCAQAAHIPVHLGSMAYAMAELVQCRDWLPGDMVVVNDPFQGGTHLPDVTLIAPVFVDQQCAAFVANRAHHADIGADSPGSMPIANRLEQEGLIISPTALVKNGEIQQAVLDWISAATHNTAITRGDFSAQISANRSGVKRIHELLAGMGMDAWLNGLKILNDYAERNGQTKGGDGLVREYEFLAPAQLTLLTERRHHRPWGLLGGLEGLPGENRLNGEILAAKVALAVEPGDRLEILTPGGGGYMAAPQPVV
jgi:N-methylhydantoinase B